MSDVSQNLSHLRNHENNWGTGTSVVIVRVKNLCLLDVLDVLVKDLLVIFNVKF